MKRVFYLAVMAIWFGFAGCAGHQNSFSKFYEQNMPEYDYSYMRENRPELFLDSKQEPRIYTTDDIVRDGKDLIENNGCFFVGASAFEGPAQDIDDLKDFAKDLGTPIVLLYSEYMRTRNASGVMPMPNSTTTYSRGNVNTSGTLNFNRFNAGTTYSGSSTTYGTSYIPYSYSVDVYAQEAAFFACKKRRR